MTQLGSAWSYFSEIVDWVSSAVSWLAPVLSNPIYLWITLVILVLILVPWTEN